MAIKTDGTLWSWGKNNTGQLGISNSPDRSSPVQVGALTTWSKIAGTGAIYRGFFTYISGFFSAIKTDGTLWSWGFNYAGQLGIGNTTAVIDSPVQVGALTEWSKLSINGDTLYMNGWNTAVIKTNGTLWAWGRSNSGQLANGTTNAGVFSAPVQLLSGISDWTSVSVIGCNGGSTYGSMLAIRTT